MKKERIDEIRNIAGELGYEAFGLKGTVEDWEMGVKNLINGESAILELLAENKRLRAVMKSAIDLIDQIERENSIPFETVSGEYFAVEELLQEALDE